MLLTRVPLAVDKWSRLHTWWCRCLYLQISDCPAILLCRSKIKLTREQFIVADHGYHVRWELILYLFTNRDHPARLCQFNNCIEFQQNMYQFRVYRSSCNICRIAASKLCGSLSVLGAAEAVPIDLWIRWITFSNTCWSLARVWSKTSSGIENITKIVINHFQKFHAHEYWVLFDLCMTNCYFSGTQWRQYDMYPTKLF